VTAAAVVALEPVRSRLLSELAKPASAASLSARLGIAPGTVRWRLKVGLAALRERLDQHDLDGGRKWRRVLLPLAPAGMTADPGLRPPALFRWWSWSG